MTVTPPSAPAPPAVPASPGGGLHQSLRPRHMTMIAFGGVIGAGLFVGSSAVIHQTGPAAVLSYLAAGLIVVMVLRMLAEMAVASPEVGSFAAYARESLGPGAGFTIGWLYWYQWAITLAIEAVAGAGVLTRWVDVPISLLSIGLLALLTASNLLSARSFGEFEFWFSSIKITTVVVFVAVCAGWLLGIGPDDSPGLGNLADHGGFVPEGTLTVLSGVVIVFFSFYGGEVVTIAAAESPDPVRAVARAAMTMIVRILLFYVVSIFLVVAVMDWRDVVVGESPFTAALDVIGLTFAGDVMSVVVLTAVLSCLNSGLYAASRMAYAMAVRGDAAPALARTSHAGVPVRAILMTSATGFAAILVAYTLPGEAFTLLVSSAGAIAIVVYLLIALSQVRMRRRLEREAPERLQLRMWLFPWLSYATILAMAGILVAMAFVPEMREQLIPSAVSVLAVVAIHRRRARRAGARG